MAEAAETATGRLTGMAKTGSDRGTKVAANWEMKKAAAANWSVAEVAASCNVAGAVGAVKMGAVCWEATEVEVNLAGWEPLGVVATSRQMVVSLGT